VARVNATITIKVPVDDYEDWAKDYREEFPGLAEQEVADNVLEDLLCFVGLLDLIDVEGLSIVITANQTTEVDATNNVPWDAIETIINEGVDDYWSEFCDLGYILAVKEWIKKNKPQVNEAQT
jgi:hypothetical protein